VDLNVEEEKEEIEMTEMTVVDVQEIKQRKEKQDSSLVLVENKISIRVQWFALFAMLLVFVQT
jgi:hypothetical protein